MVHELTLTKLDADIQLRGMSDYVLPLYYPDRYSQNQKFVG
ncbi:MAG: hypothetical protein VB120_02545 [Lachnospiraceae bacterium]|nr:hypothetical protein [Lachnospiraceae bacterium]